MNQIDGSSCLETYRQGDVLFVRIREDQIPAGAAPSADPVLARGEATGHAHRLGDPGAALHLLEEASQFLLVVRPLEVVHEEHRALALPPGAYRVILQREFPVSFLPRARD
jgi:hypothetical protein